MADLDDLSGLMRRARQGDDEAYRRFLQRAAAWLRPVVRRGLAAAQRSDADLEDIVQETLLAMHLKRDTWDVSLPIEPWMRAIAHHKLVDHLRRRGHRQHLDIDDYIDTLEAPDGPDPVAGVDARRLLAELPERQRRIVEEISMNGRHAAEVAAMLDTTEGAIRVALHRALKALATIYRKGLT